MAKKIETDLRTFVKFWLVPIGILVVLFLIDKAIVGLVIIGISIFLALALKPLVHKVNNFFTRHFGRDKKHQKLSAVFAYLIVVLVIGAIISIVGPVVVNETARFIQHFPETFETTLGGWDGVNSFGRSIGIGNLEGEITNAVSGLSNDMLSVLGNNLISSVSGVADIIMKIVLILVLTLLFLLEGPNMVNTFWKGISGEDKENKSVSVAKRIVSKMANVVSIYVSRQVVVAITDGCAAAVMVLVLSLIFGFSQSLALPMGMITMTFYLIPMFGQFIGGTLVTLILLFSNPVAGLTFAIIYIVYSQIENNVISPKIQGDALKLKPLLILCAVTIGMYMFGLLGAIIAIPIAGCIRVLVEEYPNIKALRD
ncbi:MAG: AI-2E family transporter [Candidatus Saccharimonadaceae bacterium]|nr:AI-2E family transporter [Candidatus Saccharimonadaceae bacterium]